MPRRTAGPAAALAARVFAAAPVFTQSMAPAKAPAVARQHKVAPGLYALAASEYSIPSASAVSTKSSKTFGESVEPRPITGPEPSGWLPA